MSKIKFLSVLSFLAISTTFPTIASADDSEIVLWIGTYRPYKSIVEIGKKFQRDTGYKVVVEIYDDIHIRFQQEAIAKRGPDIFVWAHDRFGEWVQEDLIAPISPSPEFRKQFTDSSWQAFKFNDTYYGYPLTIEADVQICNKDIVKEPLKAYEDIEEFDSKVQHMGKKGFLFDFSAPYHTYPIIASQGGYSFKQTESGFDPNDVGINTDGAKEALAFVVDLVKRKIIPRSTDYGVMEMSFMNGNVGCIINGPWSFNKYEQNGIHFSVNPLPTFRGKLSRPFIGYTGFGINNYSHNKDKAIEFLEKYLLTKEGFEEMDKDYALGAVPHKTYQKILENTPGKGEKVAVIMQQAVHGDLMPNIPQMNRFWAVFERAISDSTKGKQTPEKSLDTARSRIKN